MLYKDAPTTGSLSEWTVLLNSFAYVFLAASFAGCGALQERYVEKHVLKNLTVIFLDERSLHEQWKQTVGSEAVRFRPQINSTIPHVQTVKGFYDFATNTLYCPKWEFEICGHELHHATVGHFHQD